MKKFLNFIISKIFKIPKVNLDNIYPPINLGEIGEPKKFDIVPIYASIETPLPGDKEFGQTELAYLIGLKLKEQGLINYSIEFNACLGIWVHKATIKVVRS